jgi:hypothetical protein
VVARRLFLAFGALCVTVSLASQPASSAEYRVKAVFLFNFVQFVEWPAEAFTTSTAPIEICVLGADPFGEALDQTVEGESIHNRSLVVRRLSRTSGLGACHLLFVSRSEQERLTEVLRALEPSTGVLTVSDIDGFVGRGGTIGFFIDRQRVRFEISPTHAHDRGLKVSSQLLSLGRIHGDRR